MAILPNPNKYVQGLTWLLLLGALLLRVEHRYAYRNFFLDTEVQVAGAWQMMQRRGFTQPELATDDLSQTRYEAIEVFMPGYAQTLQPILWLTQDPYRAVLWLDGLSLLLLFGALRVLFGRLTGRGDSLAERWAYVFLALSPAPLHYLTASELWCLSLLAWAWWLMVGLRIRSEKREARGEISLSQKETMRWGLALALCLWAGWSRTAYLPLCGLPLGYWLWQSYCTRSWRWPQGLALLAGTTLGFALILNQSLVLSAYAAGTSAKWYLAHLLRVEPFALKAFVYYGPPHEAAVAARFPALFPWLKAATQLLSLGLLTLAGWLAWRQRNDTSRTAFFQVWLLSSAAVLAMLAYQSLRHPPETWNALGFWTYLMEPRYFAPIMLGLLIWLFASASRIPQHRGQKLLWGWLLLATLAAYSYPLWLKIRLHLLEDPQGTFLVDPTPNLLRTAQAVADTAAHPLRMIAPLPGQAVEMIGIPQIDPAAWNALAQQPTSAPIYLLTDSLQATQLPRLDWQPLPGRWYIARYPALPEL